MRRQRSMLANHLRDAVHSDDITRKVVTRAGDDVGAFIERELDKHRKQVGRDARARQALNVWWR